MLIMPRNIDTRAVDRATYILAAVVAALVVLLAVVQAARMVIDPFDPREQTREMVSVESVSVEIGTALMCDQKGCVER